jgi:hypothetical protein
MEKESTKDKDEITPITPKTLTYKMPKRRDCVGYGEENEQM